MENKEQEAQKTIHEQFELLPPDLKQIIASNNLDEQVKLLADKHSLQISQAGKLENEIYFILLGMEKPEHFVSNLEKELRIDRTLANAIAVDANDRIFKNVRNLLKKLYDEQKPNPEQQKPAPSQTAVEQNIPSTTPQPNIPRPPTPPPPPTAIQVPPSSTHKETLNIPDAGDKLSGPVALPQKKDEVVIEDSPANTATYKENDPYREPIE